MRIVIKKIGTELLSRYAEIPIAFMVESIFHVDLVDKETGETQLREERLNEPYLKDYDSYAECGPEKWVERFDIRPWGIFLARENGRPIGGATIACKTPGLQLLEGRNDLAVLWDFRVHPDYRKQGIGKRLFGHAVRWSQDQGYRQMKIETQNVNVPACRFYAGQGCRLDEVNPSAYSGSPAVAHEVQLIWYFDF